MPQKVFVITVKGEQDGRIKKERTLNTIPDIRVGTCGWADPTLLKAGFYPRQAKTARSRMEHYSSLFDLVEADSTYYAVPDIRTTGNWADWTPKGFVFDIKAFRLFTMHPTPAKSLPPDLRDSLPPSLAGKTHLYANELPETVVSEIWKRFESALLPLDSAGKLGVVLFQFPPWFNPMRSNMEYLAGLQDRLPQYKPAIEFRNALWYDATHRSETFDLLERLGLSLVIADEPQGFMSSIPPVAETTTDIAVIRFHGRNGNAWEKKGITAAERFNYLYTKEELEQWVPRIASLGNCVDQFHILFNNCFGDKAVTNAKQMSAMLGFANGTPRVMDDWSRIRLKSDKTTNRAAPGLGEPRLTRVEASQ